MLPRWLNVRRHLRSWDLKWLIIYHRDRDAKKKTCALSHCISLTGILYIHAWFKHATMFSLLISVTLCLHCFFKAFQPHLKVFISSWNVCHVITSGRRYVEEGDHISCLGLFSVWLPNMFLIYGLNVKKWCFPIFQSPGWRLQIATNSPKLKDIKLTVI